MYCQTCIHDTVFESFNNPCTDHPHWAMASARASLDTSGPTQLISGNSFVDTAISNRMKFNDPVVAFINPSDCVDMSCDKHRRNLIVDNEGVLSGTGAWSTFMSNSEFEWDGNTRFGLGNNRIPLSMYTNLDGSMNPLETYAPKKGAVKGEDCVFDETMNGYNCGDSKKYTYLIMESLDSDTEVRRLSPIGFRSSDGHIDLVNGPADHSCCSGYACQVRVSMFKMLMACDMEYDLHATSTLPKKVRFHMPYQNDDCKIKINMYMARQNRIDVFQNGDYIPPMNTKSVNADGSLEYHLPNAAFEPVLDANTVSGLNYMDRRSETLHFTMTGGNVIDVETATSIILNLDVVMDVTTEEFYDSSSFPEYLAALLGVDPSMIRIVDVIREDTPSRRKRQAGQTGLTVEIGSPSNNNTVNNYRVA